MKKFFHKFKKDEKGIALLFTLGILALLLIMALAFATNSIVDQKVASATNTRSQTRLLARTAVNRAIAGMTSAANHSLSVFDEIKSHDADSTHQNSSWQDFLGKINTDIAGAPIYELSKTYYSSSEYANSGALHWQYVKNADSEIIGRYAYVVIPSNGALDPSAVVDSGKNGTPLKEDQAVGRPGVEVNEIYLDGLNSDPLGYNIIKQDQIQKMSVTSATGAGAPGTLDPGKRWLDFETLFDKVGVAKTDTALMQFYRNNLVLKNLPDPEAYWIDASPYDKIKTEDELYHRFDLTRKQIDWDSIITVDHLLCESGHEPQKFSVTNTTAIDNAGIPFLRQICSSPGTFQASASPVMSAFEVRRRQIAANLIDYCDSGNVPTSNLTLANLNSINTDVLSTWPLYMGNERTFNIYQLTFSAVPSIVTTSNSPLLTDHYTVSLTLGMEAYIANMYENADANGYRLTVSGRYNYQISVGGSSVAAPASPSFFKITIPFGSTNSLGLASASSTINPTLVNDDYANGASIDVNLTSFEIYSAVLSDGTNNVDFSNIQVPVPASDLPSLLYSATPSVPATFTGSTTYYLTATTNDPRQNLNPGDWSLKYNGTTTPSLYSSNPSSGSDPETVTIPEYNNTLSTRVSTAYIRNAKMESPWELGAIHRGAAWETINLKYYDSDLTYSVNGSLSSAGAAYTATNSSPIPKYTTDGGDAEILDQVKMTGRTQVYGKVNVNSEKNSYGTFDNVFRALFYNIRYGTDYLTPGSTSAGAAITKTNANTIAANLDTYRKDATSKQHEFESRAQIASLADFRGYGTTDAVQEEITGKFINLTKADKASSVYTIIAIAQSIKDAGPSTAITISKDLDGDGATTGASEVKLGEDINGDGDKTDTGISETGITIQKGEYNQYGDEITGEQKLIVTVSYNSVTKKFRIINYRFLEE